MFRILALLLVAPTVFAADITNIRYSASPDKTRMVIDLTGPVKASHQKSPGQLVLTLSGIDTPSAQVSPVPQLQGSAQSWSNGVLILTFDFKPGASLKYFRLDKPDRVVVDFYGKAPAVAAKPKAKPAPVAKKAVTPVQAPAIKATPISATAPIKITREQARKALAARISELSDAVVAGEIAPADGRRKLISYRDTLSAALAGRDYDKRTLAEALNLPMPAEPISLPAVSAPKLPADQPVKQLTLTEQPIETPISLPKSDKAEQKSEPAKPEQKPESVEPAAPAPSADQLPAVAEPAPLPEAAPEPMIAPADEGSVMFVEIDGIRRPVLIDGMDIDFDDPFNPLELMFEAERQLLWADLQAIKAQKQ